MFDIITSRDFLAKLEADWDDFMKEPHSARLALNCAITAFHLHEWVIGSRPTTRPGELLKSAIWLGSTLGSMTPALGSRPSGSYQSERSILGLHNVSRPSVSPRRHSCSTS
jgi:hypothetical protein